VTDEGTEDLISFHTTDIDLSPLEGQEDKHRRWLLQVVKNEGKSIEHLSYIFCTDEYLLNINRKYLKHDYYTDIITFPYQQGDILESDIFISIDRVTENAKLFNIPKDEELRRVMVHGVLHLIGYDDHGEQNQKLMRQKEDEYLQKWSLVFNLTL